MRPSTKEKLSRYFNSAMYHLDYFPQDGPDDRQRSKFGLLASITCFIVIIYYFSTTLNNILEQPVVLSSISYPIPQGQDISIPYNHFFIRLPTDLDPSVFSVFGQYAGETTVYPFAPCTLPDGTANSFLYCIKNSTLTLSKNSKTMTVIIKIKDAYCDTMTGINQFIIGHYVGVFADYKNAKFVPEEGLATYLPLSADKDAYNIAQINFEEQDITLTPGVFSSSENKLMYDMSAGAVNYAASDCHDQMSGFALFLTIDDGVQIDAKFYRVTDFISLLSAFAGFVYGVAAFVVSAGFAIKRRFFKKKMTAILSIVHHTHAKNRSISPGSNSGNTHQEG